MIRGWKLMLLVYVGYFGVLTALRWQGRWEWVWWWVGGLLGIMLQYLDRLVYAYWLYPQEQLSVYIRHLISNKQWGVLWETWEKRGEEQQRLVSRSMLFLFGWIAVAGYVVTSTGAKLAVGLVLGVGLRLILEIISDWKEEEKLKAWLFWQIKRPISRRELRVVVGIFAVMFLGLTIAVV